MVFLSLHLASTILSLVFSFICTIRTWQHYKETKIELVKYLAFGFFYITISLLTLIPPSLFGDSRLLPPFLSLAMFFLFLGVSFFLQIVLNNFPRLETRRKYISQAFIVLSVLLAVLTYILKPFLIFEDYGFFVIYDFSPLLKFYIVILVVILNVFFSSIIFVRSGFSTAVFRTKIRTVFFGFAFIFVGAGVLLVVIGEKLFYNFFITVGFLLFYLSVSLREKIDMKKVFYMKL